MELIITTTGEIKAITHTDAEVDLCHHIGQATTRRASHIEPATPALRWLFHTIRRNVSDSSHLAQWTRTWTCRWRVAIINGPTFGSYTSRAEAIEAEVAWLYANNLPTGEDTTCQVDATQTSH